MLFNRDKDNNLFFRGAIAIYSLLEGKTSNGEQTSDIIFIFREPTEEEIENGFTGEVVGFVYGGFQENDLPTEEKEFIQDKIYQYERDIIGGIK